MRPELGLARGTSPRQDFSRVYLPRMTLGGGEGGQIMTDDAVVSARRESPVNLEFAVARDGL